MSTLYLLDTNILVHYVRGSVLQQQIELVHQLYLAPKVPLISYVTEAELRSLTIQFGWGATKRSQLGYLLATFRRIPIEESRIPEPSCSPPTKTSITSTASFSSASGLIPWLVNKRRKIHSVCQRPLTI